MPKMYSAEDLVHAVADVRAGAKVRETGRKYNVPHTTLMDKLTGKSSLGARKGPQTVLTAKKENRLVFWLHAMAKMGMPVEPRQFLDAVEDVMTKDGRSNPFSGNRPGKKWLSLFLKRHQNIPLRKPESVGVARTLATENEIKAWHQNLKFYIESETGDSSLLEDPTRILNANESGFQTNPSTSNVFGPEGFTDLYEVKASEVEYITVMATITASGAMAPPCVVYPYERIPAEISHHINPHWSLGTSKKGWMTPQVLYGYVANTLIPFLIENNTIFPILFLVDGHKSHISYETAQLCKENGIILYSLLPNATHILQPADVSLFRPLKCQWKRVVSDWKKTTGNRSLTRANFASLMEEAFAAATPTILQNGFRKCGIYPFCLEAIDFTKCLSQETRIVDKSTEFHAGHLLYLESMFPTGLTERFRGAEEWTGEESCKELFQVWKKIKNDLKNNEALNHTTQESLQHREEQNCSTTSTKLITPLQVQSKAATVVSPTFADCVKWTSESTLKEGKARKRIKLPEGNWEETREDERRKEGRKEERADLF